MTGKRKRSAPTPLKLARVSLTKTTDPRYGIDLENAQVASIITLIGRLSGLSKSFALIMLETGARPCEILALSARRANRSGMIFIPGAKGSNDRIAFSPTFASMIPRGCLDPDFRPFASYSYRKFYRAVKSAGFHVPHLPGKHGPVCRFFRQAYAHLVHALKPGDLKLLATSLGHKREVNSLFYLQPKG